MLKLRPHGRIPRGARRFGREAVQVTIELRIELGGGGTGRGRWGIGAEPRRPVLSGQALVLALGVGELVADHRQLPLEQLDPFPMLGRELGRDADRLRVVDLGGESAAALRVGQAKPLCLELPLGLDPRLPALPDGHLQLDQCVLEPCRTLESVGGEAMAGQQTVETGAKLFETHEPEGGRVSSNVTAALYLWESIPDPGASMHRFLPFLLMVAACAGPRSGNYGCGIAAVAGQSLLIEEFTREGRVLGEPPASLPEVIPVRMALGEAYRAIVGRTDSVTLVIGVEGAMPATPVPGFGVLVVSAEGTTQGVVLYEGKPIEGAPELGTVSVGERSLPLIGLRTDVTQFEDKSCPIFPDSLRR